MESILPTLIFYLSVIVAVGVAALALSVGNSFQWVMIKSGLALLLCSTVGWMFSVMFFTSKITAAIQPNDESVDDFEDLDEDVVVIDAHPDEKDLDNVLDAEGRANT